MHAVDPSDEKVAEQHPLGTRIHIVGLTCSGKSTLGGQLGEMFGLPHIDIDTLAWGPNWTPVYRTDPDTFQTRLSEETAGDSWIVSGIYSPFCERAFWGRLQTLVWLDLPLSTILPRIYRRSWRRMRSRELVWGMNRDTFWYQLGIWRRDSLVRNAITTKGRLHAGMLAAMSAPHARHIRFLRLTSADEVETLLAALAPGG